MRELGGIFVGHDPPQADLGQETGKSEIRISKSVLFSRRKPQTNSNDRNPKFKTKKNLEDPRLHWQMSRVGHRADLRG